MFLKNSRDVSSPAWCAYHNIVYKSKENSLELLKLEMPSCFEEDSFVVVDLEATSSDAATAEIIEIGVVTLDAHGHIEEQHTQLVEPSTNFLDNVHGLRLHDTKGSPKFSDCAEWLYFMLKGRVLVAHEARFEISLLQKSFAKVGIDYVPNTIICTRENLHYLDIRSGVSLEKVCARLGISHENSHTALGDATATAELLKVYLQTSRFEGRLIMLPHAGCTRKLLVSSYH